MTSKRPILRAEDLEEAEERPLVMIGGVGYELRSGESVSMAVLTRLGVLSREFTSINQEEPDATERVVANLTATMRTVFYDEIPGDVLHGLSVKKMLGIVDFFMQHSGIPEL